MGPLSPARFGLRPELPISLQNNLTAYKETVKAYYENKSKDPPNFVHEPEPAYARPDNNLTPHKEPNMDADPTTALDKDQHRIMAEYLEKLLAIKDPVQRQAYHENFTDISNYRWLKTEVSWPTIKTQYQGLMDTYQAKYPGDPPPKAYTQPLNPTTNLPLNSQPSEFLDAARTIKTPQEYEELYRQFFKFPQGTIKPISPQKIALFQEPHTLPIATYTTNPTSWANLAKLANHNGIALNGLIPAPQDVAQHGLGIIQEAQTKFKDCMSQTYYEHEFDKGRSENPAINRAFGIPQTPEELFGNFVKEPYGQGIAVPPFGVTEHGLPKVMEGYFFSATEDAGHTVALQKPLKDGTYDTIKLSKTHYDTIIENAKIPAASPKLTPEIIQKYEQAANIDVNKVRLNTAENFWHNYRVLVRTTAQNPVTAMKVAQDIYNGMRTPEREKFQKALKSYEKKFSEPYNDRLLNFYHDTVRDIPIKNRTPYHEDALTLIKTQQQYIDIPGKAIDKNLRAKIGDTVNLTIAVPDLLTGETHKALKTGLVLQSSSEELNKVVLMEKDGSSKYVLTRDDFITRMRKIELLHEKQDLSQEKKERKKAMRESVGFGY
jgi:hypothetical protein